MYPNFFLILKFSFDVIPALNGLGKEDFVVSNDRLPIGTIPIFAGSSPEYQSSVSKMVSNANEIFASFLQSEEGSGFCGHVCLIGDSMGSILAYDALCRDIKRSSSEGSVNEDLNRRSPFNGGESIPSSPKIRTSTDHEGIFFLKPASSAVLCLCCSFSLEKNTEKKYER